MGGPGSGKTSEGRNRQFRGPDPDEYRTKRKDDRNKPRMMRGYSQGYIEETVVTGSVKGLQTRITSRKDRDEFSLETQSSRALCEVN